MYEELDVRPLLSALSVPTLVLYRAEDRVVPPALSRTVARGIRGPREVELDGADHLFLAGDQDAMIDEIEEFVTGRPPVAVSDRILATVLLSEIVVSTDRAVALGDRRWRELLGQYGRLVERELAHYGGRLVKWTGGGVPATFDGPARAVRSALAIRARARAVGLEVRAGIHARQEQLSCPGPYRNGRRAGQRSRNPRLAGRSGWVARCSSPSESRRGAASNEAGALICSRSAERQVVRTHPKRAMTGGDP